MSGIRRYLVRKIIIYILTFIFAVTIDFIIPRLMPGDPIAVLLSRFATLPDVTKYLHSYFMQAFGLDKPLWVQYITFWKAVLHGDLGISIYYYPKPVAQIIKEALPYDLALLVPSIVASWIVGNWLGALAGKNRKLDSYLMPIFYFLQASPYFWFAILLAYLFSVKLGWFPIAGAYSYGIIPSLSWTFIKDYLHHWFLPFLSLFLVQLGGWAIGMRNMIIYEIEADYARYLESLGASERLIMKHAFKNAMLPQITGLALQLGLIVAGNVTVQVVFSYPGIGYVLMQGILNQDYFLIQGCFLVIILNVLVANFLIDLLYAVVDPRVRSAYMEGA
ncbi:ABC transporter permease [Thermococcus chitonophagus]|uniref:Mannoside ABC transport system, permease protein 1 n=1 Tax=Thermococcus chitonophagus TaxID=54262 RepID=A0A161KA08_9EURY|nr:ABC transporter permease [Thermococcus chitonophagus]CUX78928.1 Mannoside ABC transport system, permease protein 1 [Thermococcus chitonophagus]